jgi:predicted RNA-binding protein with PUA-like domain
VTLKELKAHAALSELPLIRHTRLSVMPVQSGHYQRILKLAETQT